MPASERETGRQIAKRSRSDKHHRRQNLVLSTATVVVETKQITTLGTAVKLVDKGGWCCQPPFIQTVGEGKAAFGARGVEQATLSRRKVAAHIYRV